MKKEVILTGIKPNNIPTLGNYLGAMKPMVNFAKNKSDDYKINMFIPDLHSITVKIRYSELGTNIINNLLIYSAAGLPLNDDNILIYRQSHVPAHSELAWILSCFTSFGEASRMVEFKDKSKKLSTDRVSVGLYNYPILMAADILLYDTKWIPVGDDQRQHLELCILLAKRINESFGETFTVPASKREQESFLGRHEAPRIRSLKNPTTKMSKSIDDPNGTIALDDEPSTAIKKILSATTDSIGTINYNWDDQPGITNLLEILSLTQDESIEKIKMRWVGTSNYKGLKEEVAHVVKNELEYIQKNISMDNVEIINAKLKRDEEIANKIANLKLEDVQRKVGLK